MRVQLLGVAVIASLLAGQAFAQAGKTLPPLPAVPQPYPYGMPITLEQAKKAAAAMEAGMVKMKLTRTTFAIVEPSGELVLYEKATQGPYAAFDMSVNKARSAARESRPTSFDQGRVRAGEDWIMSLKDVYPSAGALPIVIDGHTIGAIGVTGGGDEVIAQMGIDALK